MNERERQKIHYERLVNCGAIQTDKIKVVRVGDTIQCPGILHSRSRKPQLMKKDSRGYSCPRRNCDERVLFGEIAN